MTTRSKLVVTYETVDGSKRSFTYNYANPNVTTSAVSTLCNTLTSQGSIYKYPPSSVISAKLVTTVESEFSLN